MENVVSLLVFMKQKLRIGLIILILCYTLRAEDICGARKLGNLNFWFLGLSACIFWESKREFYYFYHFDILAPLLKLSALTENRVLIKNAKLRYFQKFKYLTYTIDMELRFSLIYSYIFEILRTNILGLIFGLSARKYAFFLPFSAVFWHNISCRSWSYTWKMPKDPQITI